jgi:hypothetical protein
MTIGIADIKNKASETALQAFDAHLMGKCDVYTPP